MKPMPIRNRTWLDLAACSGTEDPDLFFPVGSDGPSAIQIEQAKEVCHRCPVISECRTSAPMVGGIWGGMTEAERKSEHVSKLRKAAKERKVNEHSR
jgi:WhiB family redox-sensing transcriptional regulator